MIFEDSCLLVNFKHKKKKIRFLIYLIYLFVVKSIVILKWKICEGKLANTLNVLFYLRSMGRRLFMCMHASTRAYQ